MYVGVFPVYTQSCTRSRLDGCSQTFIQVTHVSFHTHRQSLKRWSNVWLAVADVRFICLGFYSLTSAFSRGRTACSCTLRCRHIETKDAWI